jgi:AraC-like DNA-binding protein
MIGDPPAAQVRAATLTHFASVATACGLDPRALVAEVGLPSSCLDDPDLMLPAARVGRLLELAARRAPEPAFGLRMAMSRRLSNLGPLGLLMRDQPTLRHALGALVRHIHMHNQAMSIALEEADGWVTIREDAAVSGGKPARQATEMALGTTLRLLNIFMGEAWRPQQVCFTHAAPPDIGLHQRVFGPAVAFGQDFNGIVCKAADLDAPNPGADPVMARYTRRLLEKAPARNAPMSDRVRRVAVLLLPRGHCSAEIVAQHLGVTRRTVANHLASEHTTFSGVVDSMRQELLSRYLAEGTHSLSQVSALLGFSEPSAFSRWHRQRHGVTARTRLKARDALKA